jgi:glycosyltransferase involved in cell wall biosynthesis
MELILLISSLSLFLIVINSITIKVVRDAPKEFAKSVSVLIPMRNEFTNAKDCLDSLVKQQGLKNFEIIVLDDESTDGTLDLVKQISKVNVINGRPKPSDWLGKLWACHQLSQRSNGEYLVFVDADVRFSKNAIASALDVMGNLDFISPYPKQIANGFIARLFQPLLQWSWLASVPLFLTYRFPKEQMAVANGQFFIVKKSAYLKSGGHFAIKNEVLDDLMLARNLIGNGFKGIVAEASSVAVCEMYHSARELIRGYQKSLHKAFGSFLGTLFALSLLISTGIIPIIAALRGSEIGLLSFVLVFTGRLIASIRTGSAPMTAIMHPLAIAFLVVLIFYSWYGKVTKTLIWRNRILNG